MSSPQSSRNVFPPPRSRRKCVTELAPQVTIDQVFLATRKQLRPNRHGQLYLQVELADRSGTITGRMWNASDEHFEAFSDGDYVRVAGTTQLYSGALQIILTEVDQVDPTRVDETAFRVLTQDAVARLRQELNDFAATLQESLPKLVFEEVLSDAALMEAFERCPAGIKHHHAYAGGLLEHVVMLLRLADRVASLYPELDRDLLLVGVLVHDIGKTVELENEKGFSYTDSGQLLGHVLLGIEIVDDKIRKIEERTGQPFDQEVSNRIKHMVASHHGEYAFGAPKLPMTLEAIALHFIDALDAKLIGTLQLFQSEAAIDDGWTQYHPNHGRKFFRGRDGSPS